MSLRESLSGDEYRKRASRGDFLTDEERQVLVQVEALLYPTARKHWDIIACWCPLCVAHTNIMKATLEIKTAELEARKRAEQNTRGSDLC